MPMIVEPAACAKRTKAENRLTTGEEVVNDQYAFTFGEVFG